MNKTKITDRYDASQDNPTYEKLIQIGEITDETGKVPITPHDLPEGLNNIVYVKSGSGYYDVWRSNAQKMVRRGNERGALKSLYEIIETGDVFCSNIFNRFFHVMVSEDIGWAEPQLPSYVVSLVKRYHQNKSVDRSFLEEIVRGVQVLARCRKSRYVDYLFSYAKKCLNNRVITTPNNLLIEMLENSKSQIITRVIAILLLDGSNEKITTSSTTDKRLVRRRRAVFLAWQYLLDVATPRIKKQVDALLDIYLLSDSESILCLIHAFILVYAEDKGILVWKDLPVVETSPSWEEIASWEIWPDASAYDKHTRIGRFLGRGVDWFYRYGGKIANGVEEYEEEELKAMTCLLSN